MDFPWHKPSGFGAPVYGNPIWIILFMETHHIPIDIWSNTYIKFSFLLLGSYTNKHHWGAPSCTPFFTVRPPRSRGVACRWGLRARAALSLCHRQSRLGSHGPPGQTGGISSKPWGWLRNPPVDGWSQWVSTMLLKFRCWISQSTVVSIVLFMYILLWLYSYLVFYLYKHFEVMYLLIYVYILLYFCGCIVILYIELYSYILLTMG